MYSSGKEKEMSKAVVSSNVLSRQTKPGEKAVLRVNILHADIISEDRCQFVYRNVLYQTDFNGMYILKNMRKQIMCSIEAIHFGIYKR